ncbi:uncharacterized protein LOC133778164 isoform X2 [Humulus lupulus]|uniref:uncharacterized protein LOC133778164 isoform X2 n=1 Tax=Humulus lupulus TaxID=3486 RepID=UPI002B4051B9|nr:uncharacterized protein LOC133778164 isoform X2 [Humulus lupulus]
MEVVYGKKGSSSSSSPAAAAASRSRLSPSAQLFTMSRPLGQLPALNSLTGASSLELFTPAPSNHFDSSDTISPLSSLNLEDELKPLSASIYPSFTHQSGFAVSALSSFDDFSDLVDPAVFPQYTFPSSQGYWDSPSPVQESLLDKDFNISSSKVSTASDVPSSSMLQKIPPGSMLGLSVTAKTFSPSSHSLSSGINLTENDVGSNNQSSSSRNISGKRVLCDYDKSLVEKSKEITNVKSISSKGSDPLVLEKSKLQFTSEDSPTDHVVMEQCGTVAGMENSSKRFDDNESDLDSPCWKGLQDSKKSPFKASESLNSHSLDNELDAGSSLSPQVPQLLPELPGSSNTTGSRHPELCIAPGSKTSALRNTAGSKPPGFNNVISYQYSNAINEPRKESSTLKISQSSSSLSSPQMVKLVDRVFTSNEMVVAEVNVEGYADGTKAFVNNSTEDLSVLAMGLQNSRKYSFRASKLLSSQSLDKELVSCSSLNPQAPQFVPSCAKVNVDYLQSNCAEDYFSSLLEGEHTKYNSSYKGKKLKDSYEAESKLLGSSNNGSKSPKLSNAAGFKTFGLRNTAGPQPPGFSNATGYQHSNAIHERRKESSMPKTLQSNSALSSLQIARPCLVDRVFTSKEMPVAEVYVEGYEDGLKDVVHNSKVDLSVLEVGIQSYIKSHSGASKLLSSSSLDNELVPGRSLNPQAPQFVPFRAKGNVDNLENYCGEDYSSSFLEGAHEKFNSSYKEQQLKDSYEAGSSKTPGSKSPELRNAGKIKTSGLHNIARSKPPGYQHSNVIHEHGKESSMLKNTKSSFEVSLPLQMVKPCLVDRVFASNEMSVTKVNAEGFADGTKDGVHDSTVDQSLLAMRVQKSMKSPFRVSESLNSHSHDNEMEAGSSLNPQAPQFFPSCAKENVDCFENTGVEDCFSSCAKTEYSFNLSYKGQQLNNSYEAGSKLPGSSNAAGLNTPGLRNAVGSKLPGSSDAAGLKIPGLLKVAGLKIPGILNSAGSKLPGSSNAAGLKTPGLINAAGSKLPAFSNANAYGHSNAIYEHGKESAKLKNSQSSSSLSFSQRVKPFLDDRIVTSKKMPVTDVNVSGFADRNKDVVHNNGTVNLPVLAMGHNPNLSSSGVGVVDDCSEVLQFLSQSLSKCPKINVATMINVISTLSELLLQNCSNDLDSLNEHEHEMIRHIINNLYELINHRVGEKAPMFDLAHAGSLDYLDKLTAIHEANVDSQLTTTRGLFARHELDSRSDHDWHKSYPHLSTRKIQDVCPSSQDVGSDRGNNISPMQDFRKALKENHQLAEEVHPQALLNLWLEAEGALCSMKYENCILHMKLALDG